MRAMAIWINEATKLVFSRTLKDVTWRNSRLLHELDPREIDAMKRQPGKNMIVFGSGSLVSQLTQHGLIDEYQFVVNPILLGSGQPLLSGGSKSSALDLLEVNKIPIRQRHASVRTGGVSGDSTARVGVSRTSTREIVKVHKPPGYGGPPKLQRRRVEADTMRTAIGAHEVNAVTIDTRIDSYDWSRISSISTPTAGRCSRSS